jgi:hypothetical protein
MEVVGDVSKDRCASEWILWHLAVYFCVNCTYQCGCVHVHPMYITAHVICKYSIKLCMQFCAPRGGGGQKGAYGPTMFHMLCISVLSVTHNALFLVVP